MRVPSEEELMKRINELTGGTAQIENEEPPDSDDDDEGER